MEILVSGGNGVDLFSRPHDPISYIPSERPGGTMSNIPVPLGMFMNMSHVPPRFYNQHQQALQGMLLWIITLCSDNVSKDLLPV